MIRSVRSLHFSSLNTRLVLNQVLSHGSPSTGFISKQFLNLSSRSYFTDVDSSIAFESSISKKKIAASYLQSPSSSIYLALNSSDPTYTYSSNLKNALSLISEWSINSEKLVQAEKLSHSLSLTCSAGSIVRNPIGLQGHAIV